MSILALTSDTLAGTAASGQIEYNGQFYGTDSNAARGQFERLSLASVQNTTSGTAIDFTVPAWAKRITVILRGVSTSNTNLSTILLRLGSGTIQTTGYTSVCSFLQDATVVSVGASTGGFLVNVTADSAALFTGTFVLTNYSGNLWVCAGQFANTNSTQCSSSTGGVSLSGTLDTVRLTTTGGNNAFDAGAANILIEG